MTSRSPYPPVPETGSGDSAALHAALLPKLSIRSQNVLEHLLDLLAHGRLRHGDRLPPERELAARLNVTRGAVRAAVRVLVEKGLLQSRQGDGTYVCAQNRGNPNRAVTQVVGAGNRSIRHLLEFRLAVEPSIAEVAARNISQEQINELKIIVCDQQCRVFSEKEDRDLNAAFHLALARGTNNPIFVDLLDHLNDVLLEVWPEGSRDSARQQQSILEHLHIVNALEKRDAKACRAAMEQHIAAVPPRSLTKEPL